MLQKSTILAEGSLVRAPCYKPSIKFENFFFFGKKILIFIFFTIFEVNTETSVPSCFHSPDFAHSLLVILL